jgi:hypothetical protein
MLKFGDKNRSFVAKALAVARQHPDILPRRFSLKELEADVQLVEDLYPLLLSVTGLQGKIQDTYFAAGSEAYAGALMVYQYAKAHNLATLRGCWENSRNGQARRQGSNLPHYPQAPRQRISWVSSLNPAYGLTVNSFAPVFLTRLHSTAVLARSLTKSGSAPPCWMPASSV